MILKVPPHALNAQCYYLSQCTLHLANGISWANGQANTSTVCSITGHDVMLVVCIKKHICHALCLCQTVVNTRLLFPYTKDQADIPN